MFAFSESTYSTEPAENVPTDPFAAAVLRWRVGAVERLGVLATSAGVADETARKAATAIVRLGACVEAQRARATEMAEGEGALLRALLYDGLGEGERGGSTDFADDADLGGAGEGRAQRRGEGGARRDRHSCIATRC
ncbi:MAG: hypothetical protein AAF823_10725 [Planctomycetota bacterium]